VISRVVKNNYGDMYADVTVRIQSNGIVAEKDSFLELKTIDTK